jgi:hypothetical protein
MESEKRRDLKRRLQRHFDVWDAEDAGLVISLSAEREKREARDRLKQLLRLARVTRGPGADE